MRSPLLAGALVVALASGPAHGFARASAKETKDPRPTPAAVGGAVKRGLVTGFKHTLHAIKPLPRGTVDAQGVKVSFLRRWLKPAAYSAMVGGIFVAGAAAQAVHVDPAPIMIALSGGAYGYQLKTRALPRLRGTRGLERLEIASAEVLYPGLLVVGSTVGGLALGHGGEAAAVAMDTAHQGHEAVHAGRMGTILGAGAQSAVIGIDVPTIVQGAADHDGMGKGGR